MLLLCDNDDAEQAVMCLRSTGLLDADSASEANRSSLIHDWDQYRSKNEAKVIAGRKGGAKSGESRRRDDEANAKQTSAVLRSASKQTRSPDPDPEPVTDPEKKICNPVSEIVDHYHSTHPGKGRQLKPGHPDWKRIEARLAEGYSVDDLKLAIDGNAIDPWHQKTSAGHTIEYVFRNATKVEAFIHQARHGTAKDPRERKGIIETTKEFLEEVSGNGDRNRQGVRSNPDGETPLRLPRFNPT